MGTPTSVCENTRLHCRHSALTSGAVCPACSSDPVSSSPQPWSHRPFPAATVVAATLEVEAWVLAGAVATPSPPAVGTAWVQVWEALASPPVAAGARRAVAPASSLFLPRRPAGRVTSTEVAGLQPPFAAALKPPCTCNWMPGPFPRIPFTGAPCTAGDPGILAKPIPWPMATP